MPTISRHGTITGTATNPDVAAAAATKTSLSSSLSSSSSASSVSGVALPVLILYILRCYSDPCGCRPRPRDPLVPFFLPFQRLSCITFMKYSTAATNEAVIPEPC